MFSEIKFKKNRRTDNDAYVLKKKIEKSDDKDESLNGIRCRIFI